MKRWFTAVRMSCPIPPRYCWTSPLAASKNKESKHLRFLFVWNGQGSYIDLISKKKTSQTASKQRYSNKLLHDICTFLTFKLHGYFILPALQPKRSPLPQKKTRRQSACVVKSRGKRTLDVFLLVKKFEGISMTNVHSLTKSSYHSVLPNLEALYFQVVFFLINYWVQNWPVTWYFWTGATPETNTT